MIAFDFDGVICDVHHIFRGHFWDRFKVILNREADQHIYDFQGVKESPDYEPWWWGEIPVAITRYQHICPPFQDAIEAMRSIYLAFDLEYIQIITAREASEAVMRVTDLWCRQNFTFPFKIDYCDSADEKADILKLMDIDYFIDDRFKTVQEVAPNLKYSYLLNQNWNMRDDTLLPNVKRVDTIWDMKHHLDYVGIWPLA
jgi:hypothetical protein